MENNYNNENLIDEVAKEIKEPKSGFNNITMIGIGAVGAIAVAKLVKTGFDMVKKHAAKTKSKASANEISQDIEDLPPIDNDDPTE